MGTDIHGVFQKYVNGKWKDVTSLYKQGRHYLLFAWLGNVRNGYGFAGVATHDVLQPLSNNRGFPDDFEVDDNTHAFEWMGDHSYSWLSDDEIINGNTSRILMTGIIDKDTFYKWNGVSEPDTYCIGISGPNIVLSSWKDVQPNITHVRIEWYVNTADKLSYFIDEVKRLKKKHGKIRFVFGFDS